MKSLQKYITESMIIESKSMIASAKSNMSTKEFYSSFRNNLIDEFNWSKAYKLKEFSDLSKDDIEKIEKFIESLK